jgi:putative membrane-bound dehydrogenase-like protein
MGMIRPATGSSVITAAWAAWTLVAADPNAPAGDRPPLPTTPPREIAEALASFQSRPGFRIELVASEPLVRDPIEICFDEDGRLYVVEMIDYSEMRDAQPHLGRIRLLQDSDGDGRFDRGTVYADDLPWPTGAFCWDGGLFVAATPDILYLKDTTGDGQADLRRRVFTGFASDYAPYRTNQLNMQAMLNSFRWGLDNRIHGSTAPNGGDVLTLDFPNRPHVNLRGRDFAFDPRTHELTAEAGGGQYGLSFDDRGRRFTCNNSDHLRVFMVDARYAARNPHFALSTAPASIATDGPAAEVFRTSPEEPWRVLRTQWRVAGLVPGPIEGGGRSSGYFTSATGITVYRGDAWPAEYHGDVFIADCGSNLVHRKKLRADGVTLTGERPADEHSTEFLTSSDLWFRPVQLANAPDGSLWVVDMYREIIEHPWSLPPGIKEQLDLNHGNDRGRLYRIVPEGFVPRPPPRLSRATSLELVQTLAHANAWHRETAARLLYTRQDRNTVTPALERLLRTTLNPLGRLHALHVLDGLQTLEPRHLLHALSDPDDRVREHAVKLAERWAAHPSPDGDSLRRTLLSLTTDPSAQVRYQLAFTLGELNHPQRIASLAALARRDVANPWLRNAVLSSLSTGTEEMFRRVRGWFTAADTTAPNDPAEYEFLKALVQIMGARNRPEEVSAVLTFVDSANPATAFTLVHALGEGLSRARAPLDPSRIEPVLRRAARLAPDGLAPLSDRVQATELLGLLPPAEAIPQLLGLLHPQEPQRVQSTALRTLGRFPDPTVGPALLDAWPTLTPRLREAALPVLLARTERCHALLNAVENQLLRRSDFSSLQLDFLMNHRDPEVRNRSLRLLTSPTAASREQALIRFQTALDLPGDPARGRLTFVERCASCHQLAGEGYAVGPDLASVRSAGREKLLLGILDPNREVLPQYLAFEIDTRDGESLLGFIVDETAHNVTLRQAYARDTIIPRDQIEHIRSSTKSVMPEELEAGLDEQEMADLLEFIGSAADLPRP